MADELDGRTAAFLVANEGIEQIELTEPWRAIEEAGGHSVLVAPQSGTLQALNYLEMADQFEVDKTVSEADVTQHDILVLPGGVANPDALRLDPKAVSRRSSSSSQSRSPRSATRPWTLIAADVIDGRRLTSWPSLRTDIRNAGGTWVDEELAVCAESGSHAR